MTTENVTDLIEAEGVDAASFVDLDGRRFTLRLPYSRFTALRLEMSIDFREATVVEELSRVEHDPELLFNVLAFLVDDQLEKFDGLSRNDWQDSMFGVFDDTDPESLGPLEEAAKALEGVVVGFIRHRGRRRTTVNALALRRQSLDAIFAANDAEVAAVNADDIGKICHTKATKGVTLLTRIEEAADEVISAKEVSSTVSPGSVPAASDSTPAPSP